MSNGMQDWECKTCTYLNPLGSIMCSVCGSSNEDNFWQCAMCSLVNGERVDNCSACGAPKDANEFLIQERDGDETKMAPQAWQCPMCYYRNAIDVPSCVMCTYENTEGNETKGNANDHAPQAKKHEDPNDQLAFGGNDNENELAQDGPPLDGLTGGGQGPSTGGDNGEMNSNDVIRGDVLRGYRVVKWTDLEASLAEIIQHAPTPKLAVGVLKSLKKVTSRVSDASGHFRVLDTRSKAVQNKLLGFEGVLEFLGLIGFQPDELGLALHCYEFPEQSILDVTANHIQKLIDEQRSKYQSQERRGNSLLDEDENEKKLREMRNNMDQTRKELNTQILKCNEKDEVIRQMDEELRAKNNTIELLREQIILLGDEKMKLLLTTTEQMNEMRSYLVTYQQYIKKLKQQQQQNS